MQIFNRISAEINVSFCGFRNRWARRISWKSSSLVGWKVFVMLVYLLRIFALQMNDALWCCCYLFSFLRSILTISGCFVAKLCWPNKFPRREISLGGRRWIAVNAATCKINIRKLLFFKKFIFAFIQISNYSDIFCFRRRF